MSSVVRLVHQKARPPKDNLLCLGSQSDFGNLYSAVAHTSVGDIPGKASFPDLCWYSHAGKENKTDDFSFVTMREANVSLVSSKHCPSNALKLGNEGGRFTLCLAIADTQWGQIPGKAAEWGTENEGLCWYPYGGKEHKTTDFKWVCEGTGDGGNIWFECEVPPKQSPEDQIFQFAPATNIVGMSSVVRLVHQKARPPKDNLLCLGSQRDFGNLYSAVAHTSVGDIPGKASFPDLCWYSHAGKENKTNDFSFVTMRQANVSLVSSKHCPSNALKLGNEGGRFTLCLAIADTQWGQIPGKAAEWGKDNEGLCWYPYGGKEYKTTEFKWVCEGTGYDASAFGCAKW